MLGLAFEGPVDEIAKQATHLPDRLHAGLDAEQAFAHVTKMRGLRVPETLQQHAWLLDNQAAIVASTQGTGDAS